MSNVSMYLATSTNRDIVRDKGLFFILYNSTDQAANAMRAINAAAGGEQSVAWVEKETKWTRKGEAAVVIPMKAFEDDSGLLKKLVAAQHQIKEAGRTTMAENTLGYLSKPHGEQGPGRG